ncbi:hypothetical protein V6N13_048366 [Hibiscus sabdariffa]
MVQAQHGADGISGYPMGADGVLGLLVGGGGGLGPFGAVTSAPKGAHAATTINQEAQHAISTHGAARDAICSMLGLHHAIRPGPPLGAPEASTTDKDLL